MANTDPQRDPLVQAALDFQKLSSEAFYMQRQREDSDLEFQVPEKQWPENVQVMRTGQSVQGVPLPPRPMLSIPSLNQPIRTVYNQFTRAHLGIHVSPRGRGATDEVAEVIQDYYRQTEVDSKAYIARNWGADRAFKCGFGAYRVDVVYDEDSDDPDDLKIVIRRILRQSSVYWDPFAEEPNFCDQKRCLIISWMSRADYKRQFPKSRMAGLGLDELTALQSQMPNFIYVGGDGQQGSDQAKWYDGANDAVCIAEFFYTEYEKENIGGRRKTREKPIIKWCKINAIEVLESQTWNGRYIPIIPCIGEELQPFDTERRWQGLITPNKDSARLLNYEVTSAVEKDALSTKAPWIGAVGQFKTNQQAWLNANTRNFPYLEYDPVMAGAQMAPPPERNLASPDLTSSIALIQLAKDMLQTGTAIVDPSALEDLAKRKVAHQTLLGMQDNNVTSQSQYVQNMADLSMAYEAMVVIDLMRTVLDRPGRVIRVRNEEGKEREVMLNQRFGYDKTGRPIAIPDGIGIMPPGLTDVQTIDIRNGVYGVVVDVSKSYKTKAKEGSDALGSLITTAPDVFAPVLSDIWMEFQDFPGHKKAAERMRKMLPEQLQGEDEKENPETIKAQRDQAAMLVEQLSQQLQEAQKAIETDQVKAQADLRKAQIDAQTKLQIAQIQAQADLEAARIKAAVEREKQMLTTVRDAALQDDQQRHEHAESAVDRAHEHATLEKQTELAEAQAENQARRGFAQGEVDHAHEDMRGEAEHQRGLESQAREHEAAERQAKASAQGDGAGE